MVMPAGFSEVVPHSLYSRIADKKKAPLPVFEISGHEDYNVIVSMARFYLSVREVYETIKRAAAKLNHEGLEIVGSASQPQGPLEQSLSAAFEQEQIQHIFEGDSFFDNLKVQFGEDIPVEPEPIPENGIRMPIYIKMRVGLLPEGLIPKYQEPDYKVVNDEFKPVGEATIGAPEDYLPIHYPYILNRQIVSSEHWKNKQITNGFLHFLISYSAQAITLQGIPLAQEYLISEFAAKLLGGQSLSAPKTIPPSASQTIEMPKMNPLGNLPGKELEGGFPKSQIPIIKPSGGHLRPSKEITKVDHP